MYCTSLVPTLSPTDIYNTRFHCRSTLKGYSKKSSICVQGDYRIKISLGGPKNLS